MSNYPSSRAFPRAPMDLDGMSLRDYFAAKAMQGVAATSGCQSKAEVNAGIPAVAEWSYRMADAMLQERAKGCGQ